MPSSLPCAPQRTTRTRVHKSSGQWHRLRGTTSCSSIFILLPMCAPSSSPSRRDLTTPRLPACTAPRPDARSTVSDRDVGRIAPTWDSRPPSQFRAPSFSFNPCATTVNFDATSNCWADVEHKASGESGGDLICRVLLLAREVFESVDDVIEGVVSKEPVHVILQTRTPRAIRYEPRQRRRQRFLVFGLCVAHLVVRAQRGSHRQGER